MQMYYIVNFTDEDTVEVVPESWVKDDFCFWPNFKDKEKLKKAIKTAISPEGSWQTSKIRILGAAGIYLKLLTNQHYTIIKLLNIFFYVTESFEKAARKGEKATMTSDLNSDDDDDQLCSARPKKRPLRFCISSDEEVEPSLMDKRAHDMRKRKVNTSLPPPPPKIIMEPSCATTSTLSLSVGKELCLQNSLPKNSHDQSLKDMMEKSLGEIKVLGLLNYGLNNNNKYVRNLNPSLKCLHILRINMNFKFLGI